MRIYQNQYDRTLEELTFKDGQTDKYIGMLPEHKCEALENIVFDKNGKIQWLKILWNLGRFIAQVVSLIQIIKSR